MGFEQAPLPYAYTALEPVIDALTMEIHYTKHAAAYASNLRDAVKAENVTQGTSVENILGTISKYSPKMRNNCGGHYNHELFWQCMKSASDGNEPKGKLSEAIISTFGSYTDMKNKFTDAAKGRFGSGWAWLYVDGNKKLAIGSTPNQDNPLMDISEIKGFPLLGIDVWEHAYYLKYQNRRPEYIENWWKLVNWEFVGNRFEKQIG
ncbi:MAG: superoxide dismutase [Chitinophagaceae bacterium]